GKSSSTEKMMGLPFRNYLSLPSYSTTWERRNAPLHNPTFNGYRLALFATVQERIKGPIYWRLAHILMMASCMSILRMDAGFTSNRPFQLSPHRSWSAWKLFLIIVLNSVQERLPHQTFLWHLLPRMPWTKLSSPILTSKMFFRFRIRRKAFYFM